MGVAFQVQGDQKAPGGHLYRVLDLQHVSPAAVTVDVKASKKKDSASVKVDGGSCLPDASGPHGDTR